jgi:hypothetical protein
VEKAQVDQTKSRKVIDGILITYRYDDAVESIRIIGVTEV